MSKHEVNPGKPLDINWAVDGLSNKENKWAHSKEGKDTPNAKD